MCISNGKFKFLDISNFVVFGFLYDKFIKFYEIELYKLYFFYEYCFNYNKFEYIEFLLYEVFFFFLKIVMFLKRSFFGIDN